MDFGVRSCPFKVEDATSRDGDDAPRFRLPGRAPPAQFPGMIGWFRAARSDALGLFPEECFRKHRVDRRVANTNLSVVSDAASIKQIFAHRAAEFKLSNLHLRILKPSLGRGVIVAEGDDWRRLRRASLAMIRAGQQGGGSQNAIDEAKRLARKHAEAPDFAESLSRLMLDLVATDILGHSHTIASRHITEAIERHRAVSEQVDLMDLLGVAPKFTSRKMREASRIAAEFDDEIFAEIGITPQSPPEQVREEEYRDLIVNLLTGFESLWLTCLWSLLALAHERELLVWLRRSDNADTFRSRLERITLEILRLYPPLPLIYRTPLADLDLASGAYRKGQLICVSPYVVQRHALNWEEPDVFAMDRPLSDYRRTEFMPFGVGVRRCVGANAAPRIVIDVLAGLLENHDPECAGIMPIPRMGLSLRPHGSHGLVLIKR
ncbi:MAG: cytochrome P450 [Erythrobacter sp.]